MSDSDQTLWHKQPRQWVGIATVTLMVALCSLLMWQLKAVDRAEISDRNAVAQLDVADKKRQSLSDDNAAIDDLLQKDNEQKEQLIHDIGDFENQLSLLRARTELLEQAHEELQHLKTALVAFQQTQDRFEGDLKDLEHVSQPNGATQ